MSLTAPCPACAIPLPHPTATVCPRCRTPVTAVTTWRPGRWAAAAGRLLVAAGAVLILLAGATLQDLTSIPLLGRLDAREPRLYLLLGCGAALVVCGGVMRVSATRLGGWALARRGAAYALLAAVTFAALATLAVAAVTFTRIFLLEVGVVVLAVLVGVALWRGRV